MSINKENLCPVCGFDFFQEFGFGPWNGESPSDEICPSCGFQFGLDDYDEKKGYNNKTEKHNKWRQKWIEDGMIWDRGNSKPPKDWDSREQLKKLELE